MVINHLLISTVHTIIYEDNQFYGQHQPIVGTNRTIPMDDSLIALRNVKYAKTPHACENSITKALHCMASSDLQQMIGDLSHPWDSIHALPLTLLSIYIN